MLQPGAPSLLSSWTRLLYSSNSAASSNRNIIGKSLYVSACPNEVELESLFLTQVCLILYFDLHQRRSSMQTPLAVHMLYLLSIGMPLTSCGFSFSRGWPSGVEYVRRSKTFLNMTKKQSENKSRAPFTVSTQGIWKVSGAER